MMLVAVPLVVTGRQLTEDLTAENNVESAVQSWVDETDLSIVELDVDGSTVSLVVAGDTEPENVDDLGAELEDVLGSDVELQVTIVPTIQLTYSSDE
jgi:hypothetical protein